MSERRNFTRRHLFYYLPVVDAKTGEEIGRIGDISPGGMLLLTKKQLPLQRIYDVEIDLSAFEKVYSTSSVTMTIETRWSHQDANPELTCVGSQLIRPNRRADWHIRNLTESFGFRQ